MKPELKAIVETVWGAELGGEWEARAKSFLRDVFLAALHWRGDELWCGPFEVGGVWNDDNTEETSVCGLLGTKLPGEWRNEYEARAALEAAAKEQIRQWFKDQGE